MFSRFLKLQKYTRNDRCVRIRLTPQLSLSYYSQCPSERSFFCRVKPTKPEFRTFSTRYEEDNEEDDGENKREKIGEDINIRNALRMAIKKDVERMEKRKVEEVEEERTSAVEQENDIKRNTRYNLPDINTLLQSSFCQLDSRTQNRILAVCMSASFVILTYGSRYDLLHALNMSATEFATECVLLGILSVVTTIVYAAMWPISFNLTIWFFVFFVIGSLILDGDKIIRSLNQNNH